MYAFRVQLNDSRPVIGGAGDLSVLTTTISAVGKLGPSTCSHWDDGDVDISLRLGGLTSRGQGVTDEHLVWFEARDLRPGDKISLEIIQTDKPDPPESGKQAKERANDERSYYEHCKRAYFEMREKYEGDA
jgi:hypothetical protein